MYKKSEKKIQKAFVEILNDGVVDKKFRPSILNSSRENHISQLRTDRLTDGRTDIVNYRVALLLKMKR